MEDSAFVCHLPHRTAILVTNPDRADNAIGILTTKSRTSRIMAYNIVSETVKNHKKNSRWTEEEILQAFDEIGATLEESFSGSIGDKHWVTFPNGDRSYVRIGCVLTGNTRGKSQRWNEEDIIKLLAEKGFTLKEPFTRTNDFHLVQYPTGVIKSVRLNYILDGRVKGTKCLTTETVNLKLAKYGAVLAEEFKGDVKKKHLVTLANGETKNLFLHSVIAGNSQGKQKHTYHDTETLCEILSQRGISLDEEFKGNVSDKHNVTFSCGHKNNVRLITILKGTGCPNCTQSGFSPDRTGYLYFVEILFEGNLLYKVGITNYSVKERFSREGVQPKPLSLFFHENGRYVRQAEQSIIKHFKDFAYIGESPFKYTRTAEMFFTDIRRYQPFFDIIQNHGLEIVPDSLIAN